MKHHIAFSLLLIVFCFSSCKLFQKEKPIQTKPDLVIGYFPSNDMLPFILAKQHGYFDSLRIKIAFQRMESKLQCDTLYKKGKIDGCIFDLTDAIRMSSQGNKIYPVMGNEGCFYLIGNPDSTVLHYKAIKNKTIALTNYSAADYLTDKLIKLTGLTNDDVNKPNISDESIRLEMLLNGQIDAGIFQEPYSTQAVRENAIKLYPYKNFHEITTVTAFNKKALSKKKEIIQKLIKGYNMAVDYINQHPVNEWYRNVADSIGFPRWKAPIKLSPFHQARQIPKANVDSITLWMKRNELIPNTYIVDIVDHTILNSIQSKEKSSN